MHQQLWGYKVEWRSVSRGTGGKKVEYHCIKGIFASMMAPLAAVDVGTGYPDISVAFPDSPYVRGME